MNKDTIDNIIITNDEQSRNELLFWKIFKFKAIFKHIFKFVRFYGSQSVSYENYISVNKMLNNNQLSLLKDKVNRNKYLSFSITDYYSFCNPNSQYKYIKVVWINLFKTTSLNNDYEFYNNLFKNYKNQIPFGKPAPYPTLYCEEIDENDKLIIIARILIKYNSSILNFLIFIGKFYKPSIKDLQYAIKKYRLESVKILLSSNEIIESIIKTNKVGTEDYKLYYPDFSDIHPHNSNLLESIACIELIYKSINFNNNIDYIFGFYKSIQNLDPINLKLNELIGLISLMELCTKNEKEKEWELIYNNNIKFSNEYCLKIIEFIKKEKYENLIIEPLNYKDFKSFKFSNQQLESKLNDPINYTSNEKENLKKLLNFFYRINFDVDNNLIVNFKNSFLEFYMAYYSFDGYDVNYHDKYKNYSYNFYSYSNGNKYMQIYFLSLEYSNYGPLKSTLYKEQAKAEECLRKTINFQNVNGGSQFSSHIYSIEANKKNLLFNKSSGDNLKKSRIEFLNFLIQDLKSNSKIKLPQFSLFKFLIEYDDLELVKYFVNGMGEDLLLQTVYQYDSISKYIKSIEMMEYLYNNFINLFCYIHPVIGRLHQNHQLPPPPYSRIHCQIENLNILKKLEILERDKQKNNQQQQPQPTLLIDVENPTIELFQYVVNNSLSLFDISLIIKSKPIDFDDNKSIYYSVLKNLIKSSPPPYKFRPFCFEIISFYEYPSIEFINFYNWYKFYNSNVIEIISPSLEDSSESLSPFISNSLTPATLKLLEYFSICATGGINGFDGDDDDYQEYKHNKLFEDVLSYKDILKNFVNISYYSTIRGDFKTLDKILNILLSEYLTNRDVQIRKFISNILYTAISNQCLSILEYILYNYPIIFKKKFQPSFHEKIKKE